MLFSQNLKFLRQRIHFSQEEVSQAIGITRSSLSGYENQLAEPPIDIIIKISEFYKINIDSLLKDNLSTWTETQLKETEFNFENKVSGKQLRILSSIVSDDNEDMIELVHAKAKAGYTTGYADPDFIKVLPAFNLPFLSKNRKYRAFPISGDSMPPVSNGSYVVAEYLENWLNIRDGFPYIIVTKEDGIVFKVVYLQTQLHQLQLCSTNPIYPPYLVHLKDVIEIWKFVNYICPELNEPKITDNQLGKTLLNLQRDINDIKVKLG